MAQTVRTLDRNTPSVYPQLVEIGTRPMNVTTHVKAPFKVPIRFKNKKISLKPPYDVRFYRAYSGKDVVFANSIPDCRVMFHIEDDIGPVDDFLSNLASEFKARNGSKLLIVKEKL